MCCNLCLLSPNEHVSGRNTSQSSPCYHSPVRFTATLNENSLTCSLRRRLTLDHTQSDRLLTEVPTALLPRGTSACGIYNTSCCAQSCLCKHAHAQQGAASHTHHTRTCAKHAPKITQTHSKPLDPGMPQPHSLCQPRLAPPLHRRPGRGFHCAACTTKGRVWPTTAS